MFESCRVYQIRKQKGLDFIVQPFLRSEAETKITASLPGKHSRLRALPALDREIHCLAYVPAHTVFIGSRLKIS